jgi:serpin B
MTLNGASGETRESILEALRQSDLSPDQINESYKYLTSTLLTIDKRVNVSVANSVWTENNFQVKKSFIDILTSYYDAESKNFDIEDPLTPGYINKWIEDKTNGLIKETVDKLEDNTVMLLINAILFKAKWKSEFEVKNTVNRTFTTADGTVLNVPMMKQTADFKVYRGKDFTVAEFPYGQGNFVMDVILPDQGIQLSSLLPLITAANLSLWTGQMNETEVILSFPRFKNGFKIKLKEILSDMGMEIAFSDFAEFTNITDFPPLKINDVTHQAFIETNEEGTEAAAATVVEIGLTSMPQSLVFNADRPFVYLIREVTTNTVLFMGRVSDPSKE